MFDLVNKATSFVASVAANVIVSSEVPADDESSRDSGISVEATVATTSTTSSLVATSFATLPPPPEAPADSQKSAIFEDFELEFVRPSRWTTSSESSEEYQERMSLIGEEQPKQQPESPTPTPSREETAKDVSASAEEDSIATTSEVAAKRKRSFPAESLGCSPLLKTSRSESYGSDQSSQSGVLETSSQSVLRELNNQSPTHSRQHIDSTTPCRSRMRKFNSLRTEVLKQRSEAMRSPDMKQNDLPADNKEANDDNAENNDEVGDDDVFLEEHEFVLPVTPMRPFQIIEVDISPIHPIDCFNEANASMAMRTRSFVDTHTPTRRFRSDFDPSDSSTPAGIRLRRMSRMVPTNHSPIELSMPKIDVRPPVSLTPTMAKSTSVAQFDLSSMDKSQMPNYHLPVTSEDGITIERCPISAETLRGLLATLTKEEFNKKYILIDARYPFEYKGGHIKHAINVFDPQKIGDFFFPSDPAKLSEMKSRTPIFYCEYSQARGPSMLGQLRKLDRDRNFERYPDIDYPELYLLHGGYKNFYKSFKKQGYCEPDRYTRMNAKRFQNELKKYSGHKTKHEKTKMKKAQFHHNNKQKRQSGSECHSGGSQNGDDQPCSSKSAAAVKTVIDDEFKDEIGKPDFLSTSMAQRYHAFDTSNEASDISSFALSPGRKATAPIPIAMANQGCNDASPHVDANTGHSTDDSDFSGVVPVQLSFSECI